VYTSEVKAALIDAMLDHSQALGIGPDEWLTVAARDSESSGIGRDDSYDAMTILLRIKGSDLMALHGGRISRDEARKRVEAKEY
jgi:hypothetical protein